MTTPSWRAAMASASADLPLAVGPAMSATFGRVSMFTATLIASGTLTAGDISIAMDRLRDAGCAPGASGWIDEGDAADLIFGMAPDAARVALEGAFAATDVVVQSSLTRTKRLLVADMDSTMITVECIDELADYAGIKPQIAEITERAMRGELDFEAALDARVALLKGLAGKRHRTLPGRTREDHAGREDAGADDAVARGALAVLVSGGFTRFAEPVAREIGFDRAIANVLEIEGGVLTGTVTKPIVGSNTKLTTLRAAIAERGITVEEESLAVGDGANDLAMIEAAGLGRGVSCQADRCGGCGGADRSWGFDGASLRAGYREAATGCWTRSPCDPPPLGREVAGEGVGFRMVTDR